MAWAPLGLRPAWFAEIEAFPSAVLAHHWPDVANLGDMCNLPYLVSTGIVDAPDILVGGTPCQAFSVAGLRKGLEDERGKLTLKFVELANEIDKKRKGDECVAVWENVPGVLSSKDNAFGCFLGALAGEECELKPAGGRWTNAGCVFGPERAIAWRVFDAQYFGVAQRRRRVFVVASAREGFNSAKVLFESEGLRRDTPPSREKASVVAALTARGVGTCGADDNQAQAGHLIKGHRMVALGEYSTGETASTMKARDYKAPTDLVTCFDSRQDPNIYGDMAGPCSASTPVNAISLRGREGGSTAELSGDLSPTLRASSGGGDKQHVLTNIVRRLTPVECERLQGFPDNHTRIPWRNKLLEDCPDGPRYKAIGNSKAVPVIKFIGERILEELNR
tara:strand:- start:240 stop:1415 length:1176 start_codon:yes stop_codon:yes gene_type:complete